MTADPTKAPPTLAADVADALEAIGVTWPDYPGGQWVGAQRDRAERTIAARLAVVGVRVGTPDGLREAAQAVVDTEDAIEAFDERADAEFHATGWVMSSEESDALVARHINAMHALRDCLRKGEPDDRS